jgi:hypothetical protein
MAAHGIAKGDYPALQQRFESSVVEIVRTLPRGAKRTVLWEDNSAAHTGGLPKDAVVEVWKEAKGDASVLDATILAGWDVIYTSKDWYFDHQPAATSLLVQSWEFHYSLDPCVTHRRTPPTRAAVSPPPPLSLSTVREQHSL